MSQSGCIPALYSLGLVDALVAVLDYAHANQVDSFFESVLGIILCLLSLTMDGKHTNNVAFAESMECFLALLGVEPLPLSPASTPPSLPPFLSPQLHPDEGAPCCCRCVCVRVW